METGYYQFEDAETRERFGSFEVFEVDASDATESFEPGFYWQACFPGCLPDGDPVGPFGDATEAYDDAMDYGNR